MVGWGGGGRGRREGRRSEIRRECERLRTSGCRLCVPQTPKDKLKCVLRCSQTIMNLLSLANERSVPAADDFMPVLIFVLIKANPPCLLSTIQYVESFYSNRLHGEEQYWWMQFSSAVEFIKTMDYNAT